MTWILLKLAEIDYYYDTYLYSRFNWIWSRGVGYFLFFSTDLNLEFSTNVWTSWWLRNHVVDFAQTFKKTYYYVAYKFSTFYLTWNFSFFNLEQFWTQIFPTIVFPVRMGIPCTP